MKHSIIVLGCAFAAAAHAQPANPNQEQADAYFAEGRDLLVNKKDAKAACEKFEKAIALDPTAPGVMLNLGLCYELQQKWATSLYWFRRAQFAASEAKPRLREYEDAAIQHTSDLVEKVAIVKIDVSQAPPDVRVTVDGRAVGPDNYARLEVDTDSVIEARAPGKALFRQPVEIDGRTGKDIVIVMTDERIAPLRDPGAGRRRMAYIVGGGGVLLWGASIGYSLLVKQRYDDGDQEFDDAKFALRYYGTGLFIAGTVAVGAAFALYFTAPEERREREALLTPVVTPDSVGIGYGGRF